MLAAGSCAGQLEQLTRADVRDEVRDALAQFAEVALRRELDQLGSSMREGFRVALDDMLAKVKADSASTAPGTVSTLLGLGGKPLDLKVADFAPTAQPSDRTASTNVGPLSPPRSPGETSLTPASPHPSPFLLPAGLSTESLEPTPFTLPQSTPATPTMSFTALLPRSSSRKDWRRSFVEKTTKANRKIEYLYGSQCRETHEVNNAIEEATKALEEGLKPHLVEDGLGGTYFVKDRNGASIAVFKPRDEEPLAPNNPKEHARSNSVNGLKEGVLVGEAAVNEYTAFLVDQASSATLRAGVCPTALVRMEDSAFHFANEDRHSAFRKIKDKVGSFQIFAQHDCTSEDVGPALFPVDGVHRLAVLDIRLCNTDRHAGNVLVRRSAGGQVADLVPIDHGYALPAAVGEATFEWLSWPAAKRPFSDAIRREILSIDVEALDALLKKRVPALRSECLRTLRVCTALLQRGVEAGLTAFDIGTLMTRQDDDDGRPCARPSALEALVLDAVAFAERDCAPGAAPEARAALELRHLDRLICQKCAEVSSGGGAAGAS